MTGRASDVLTAALASRPALTRPTGEDPDAFYAAVAAAYKEHAMTTNRVGVAIGAEAGVPTATARRWILEARRRGLLPSLGAGKVDGRGSQRPCPWCGGPIGYTS